MTPSAALGLFALSGEEFDQNFERAQNFGQFFFVAVPVLMVLMIAAAIAMHFFKVKQAGEMAERKGLDPRDARMTTALSGDLGLVATHLKTDESGRSIESRLEELTDLHRKGLISDTDHESRKAEILREL